MSIFVSVLECRTRTIRIITQGRCASNDRPHRPALPGRSGACLKLKPMQPGADAACPVRLGPAGRWRYPGPRAPPTSSSTSTRPASLRCVRDKKFWGKFCDVSLIWLGRSRYNLRVRMRSASGRTDAQEAEYDTERCGDGQNPHHAELQMKQGGEGERRNCDLREIH